MRTCRSRTGMSGPRIAKLGRKFHLRSAQWEQTVDWRTSRSLTGEESIERGELLRVLGRGVKLGTYPQVTTVERMRSKDGELLNRGSAQQQA